MELIRKRNLKSEKHRFKWLIKHLLSEFKKLKFPETIESKDQLNLFIVCTAFVRIALTYAEGIETLLARNFVEATGPLERSIYELWVELRYLLRIGTKTENAQKSIVNAVLELRDSIYSQKDESSDQFKNLIENAITEYRADFPDAFALVEQQRKKRKFHWSGYSRTKMEKDVSVPGTPLYQYLSWQAHAVLSPIRDVDVSIDEKKASISLEFRSFVDSTEESEQVAFRVGGYMFYIWNEFAEEFGYNKVSVE